MFRSRNDPEINSWALLLQKSSLYYCTKYYFSHFIMITTPWDIVLVLGGLTPPPSAKSVQRKGS